MAHGFLRRLFEVFERFKTPVDVVTTSEVSVSVTVDDARRLRRSSRRCRSSPRSSASTTWRSSAWSARVCTTIRRLVGAGAARRSATCRCGMVSQAASRRNITFVMREADLPTAIEPLHEKFFAAERRRQGSLMRILLVGHGRMGQLVESLAPAVRLRDRRRRSTRTRRRRARSPTASSAASTWRSISRSPTRW